MKNLPCLLMVLIAGCTSTPQPVSENYNGPAATVHDTATTISPSETYFCRLVRVDDRAVQKDSSDPNQEPAAETAKSRVTSSYSVPAGQPCVLSVEGIDYRSSNLFDRIFGMPKFQGNVTVKLESGREYFVKGEVSERGLLVWLEDSAGHKVSKTVREYQGYPSEKIPAQGFPNNAPSEPAPNPNWN